MFPFFCVPFFFISLLLRILCGFTVGCLDLIDFNYAVRCCTSMHLYTPVMYFCCCSLRCYAAVAAAAAVLLFVIVCRMTHFVAVVYSIPFQCFLSLPSNTIYFNVPLFSTVACTASIYLRLILYKHYNSGTLNYARAGPVQREKKTKMRITGEPVDTHPSNTPQERTDPPTDNPALQRYSSTY